LATRTQPPRIVVFHDSANPHWRWVSHHMPEYEWAFVQAPSAGGGLRNRIGRLQAAVKAAWMSRGADLVITFDEGLCSALELARLPLGRLPPHICYYFNFDHLPTGFKQRRQAFFFRRVGRFVVSSRAECMIYSDHFGIDRERFDFILWGVNAPVVSNMQTGSRPYVCAVGGNARDYPLLMQVAAARPDIRFVVVARPANLAGLNIPPNVETMCNIPYPDAMAVVKGARMMALPLLRTDAPCGHVTIVSTFYLGTPLVITASTGIEDYVKHGVTGLVCAPGAEAMGAEIDRLWTDTAYAKQIGDAAKAFAETACTENNYPAHIRGLLAPTTS
jgi:glycosyltransferase involved in cell wall biosynthesis